MPQASTSEEEELTFWEVLEILAERGGEYKVRWAGLDPDTMKPWADSWIPKSNCDAFDLVQAWNVKKQKSKNKNKNKESMSKESRRQEGATGKGNGRERRTTEGTNRTTKSAQLRTTSRSLSRADEQLAVGPPAATRRYAVARDPDFEDDVGHERLDKSSTDAASFSEPPLRIGPPRHLKRRKIVHSQEEPVATLPSHKRRRTETTETTEMESPSDSEERPTALQVLPQISEIEIPHDQQRESLIQDVHVPLASPSGQPPMKRKPPSRAVSPTLYTPARAARGQTKTSKPLRRVEVISPSEFRQIILGSTQDPIEQFSSPVRLRAQQAHHQRTQTPDTPVMIKPNNIITDSARSQDAGLPTELRETPFGSHLSSDVQHNQEQPTLVRIPSTASTQRAEIDSQSQIIYVPDSQATNAQDKLQQELQEKDDIIIELRGQISKLQEEMRAADGREFDAELEMVHLREDLQILRSAEASMVPAERLQEHMVALASAEARAEELQAMVVNMRDASRQSLKSMFEVRIQRLQDEVCQWKGLCEIMSKKDERTNDELRQKAAEHPELAARVEELQLKLATRDAEQVTSEQAIDLPDLWVCRYITSQGNPCHGLFASPTDVQVHAFQIHFPICAA